MLKTRVITAVLGLPIVLLALIRGPEWFIALFILLCITLCLLEALSILLPAFVNRLAFRDSPTEQITHRKIFTKETAAPIILAFTAAAVMFLGATVGESSAGRGLIVVSLMGVLLFATFLSPRVEEGAAKGFATLVALVYATFPWLAVWDLYEMGPSARYILLLLVVVWAGDTGAYFGGRFWGGKLFGERKLAPHISPKKTWEGAIAGLCASVIGAYALNMFYDSLAPLAVIGLCAVVGGVFGQLGDLVESSMKRFAGVKDSGILLPGHGGFLDRVDGVLFAAPAIWFVLYMGTPATPDMAQHNVPDLSPPVLTEVLP